MWTLHAWRGTCTREQPRVCLFSHPTRPTAPAVLTFLLCMGDAENGHGVELGASGVCSVTREGS